MPRSKKPSTKRPRKALLLESFEDRILCSVAPVAEIEMGPEEAPVAPPEVAHSANVDNLAPDPAQATSEDAPVATELTDAQRAAIEDVVRDSTNKIEFQENVGQFAEGVRFGFKTPFGAMQVFDDHLQIVANQYDATTGEFLGAHTVNVNFTGSQAWSIVPGGEASVAGHYMQEDGTALTPHIYNEITLRDVYTGVDLRLYSAENGIVEFDWIVAKAQDYEKIRLEFTGQDGLIFNADGSATLDLRMQDLTLKMPEVYQVIDGQKHLLGAAMVAGETEGEMRYSLTGDIVADQPLVIDPNVAWSTYFDLNDTSSANAFDSYLFAIQVNTTGVYCAGWVKETITNGSYGNYM